MGAIRLSEEVACNAVVVVRVSTMGFLESGVNGETSSIVGKLGCFG